MTAQRQEQSFIVIGERVSIFLRGKTWHANFQLNGRQVRQSLGTRNKKEAIIRAHRLEAELDLGAAPTKVRIATIAEAVAAFLRSAEVENRAKKTIQKYRFVTKTICELAERRRISNTSQLDPDFADSFRAKLKAAGKKPKTIYCALVILHSLTLFAFRRKLSDSDPLSGYKLRKPKTSTQPCWTPEQADLIVTKSSPTYREFFLLLRETGCRAGEGKFLTWADVDLERRAIHIRAKDDWKPKSGDQRKVPMTDRLAAMLCRRPRTNRWVFNSRMPSESGKCDRQISERRALVSLKKTLTELGLKGHLHTFRHTFISQALTRGVPEAVVRSWVGHVDQEVIKTYTHVSDDVSRGYVALLSNTTPIPAPTPS